MPSTTTTPRVYIACLASYNAGILFGEWVDIPCDPEDLDEAITAMLGRSRVPHAEEYGFHCYENCPSLFGENESPEALCTYAEAIEDGHEAAKIDLIIGHFGSAWHKHLDDPYAIYDERGDYYALEALGHEVPENLHMYFDWEHLESDMETEGALTVDQAPDGTLYFFFFE